MEKSIIIIGGGLTGLSAGCYGRMNGYQTTIFEMHDKAGGVATAWTRNNFTIDGAMNWLVGTRPGTQFYNYWEELGAAPNWKIHNHEQYMVIEGKDGKAFTVYCDADRFEKYLLELAPEDGGAIKEFTQAIRMSAGFPMPVDKPAELLDATDQAKMMAMMPGMEMMQKWAMPTTEFAQRLKNPYLRQVFLDLPGLPMAMFIMVLGLQHTKMAGYVIGGALALVEPIEKRYRDLGGEIQFKSRVVKILVENNRAVGVRLEDGREYRADHVVSAGDGHTVIFDLLGGQYVDETIKNMYANPKLFAPLVHVAFGVNRAFDIPSSVGGLRFPLVKPITIAGKDEKDMNVFIYNFDPTLAPAGKTVVTVYYESDYDYWQSLRRDVAKYKAEKDRIASEVLVGLEQRFPGISAQVEMRSVATPITWERYTGNWRGAYEGWMFGAYENVPKTLPGLANLYMAGQWVNPGGGMPPAVMSGNHTIQLICRDDGKQFVITKP